MSSLRTDLVVKALVSVGQPVTRENWLNLAFPGEIPEDWANETEMPEEIAALGPGEEIAPELLPRAQPMKQP